MGTVEKSKLPLPERVFSWPEPDGEHLHPPNHDGSSDRIRRKRRFRGMLIIGACVGGLALAMGFAASMSVAYYFQLYRPCETLRQAAPRLTSVQLNIGGLKTPLTYENSFWSYDVAGLNDNIFAMELKLNGECHDGSVKIRYRPNPGEDPQAQFRMAIESAELQLKYQDEPIDLMNDISEIILADKEFGRQFSIASKTAPPNLSATGVK